MRFKLALIGLVAIFLLLAGMRPDAVPYLRHEARYSDAVLAHWPNALFLRESFLERGEFPIWRETIMGGQPFAANPLNKTAYPLQWLALLFPPSLHLNVLIILHLFLAGSGMWIWARSLGLRTEAVALSTLAYVMSPRLIGHTGAGHLDVVYALAWWPWLMWSIRRVTTQSNRWLQSSLLLGLVAALLLLADVRVSLFALGSGLIYGLAQKAEWKNLSRFIPSALVFIPLVLVLIVPILLWRPYMSRAELTPVDAGLFSLEPLHFLGLLLPAHRPSIETLTYLGLPILGLSLIGVFVSPVRVRRFLLIAILFIVLYSMGSNGFLWSLLVQIFPGLLWFRVPAKAWLIFALMIPLMAGYGLQWLLEWREGSKGDISRYVRLALVALVAISIILGLFVLVVVRFPPTMGISVIVVGVVFSVILLLTFARKLSVVQLTPIILFVVFADLAWTGYQWVDWRGEATWLDPYRPLAENLTNSDRIYSPTYSLEQQVAEVYHLRLFGGVDPFQLAGIVKAVEAGSGVINPNYDPVLPSMAGAESDNDVAQANQDAIIDTAILGQWHVSHVLAPYPIENPQLALENNVNDIYIYANRDYEPRTEDSTIPDWPVGWVDLPDKETVGNFNQITMLTYLISGIAWVISIGAFIFLKLKSYA